MVLTDVLRVQLFFLMPQVLKREVSENCFLECFKSYMDVGKSVLMPTETIFKDMLCKQMQIARLLISA
jgi:hypothetical protein